MRCREGESKCWLHRGDRATVGEGGQRGSYWVELQHRNVIYRAYTFLFYSMSFLQRFWYFFCFQLLNFTFLHYWIL